MVKVLCVLGTRPEAIKLCPLIRRLGTRPDFQIRVCVTAQHRSMLDQVLATFGRVPDYDLDLMLPSQTLSQTVSRIMGALEPVIGTEAPDIVLVQGDTTTTFCGALVAFYQKIPVGHVEAGLRTWDPFRPFPEEMNRVLTARLASLHFAATEWAACNLIAEGVKRERIHVTGNSGIDALLHVRDGLAAGRLRGAEWPQLDPSKKLIVVTAHRRESFGDGLDRICKALAVLARRHDVEIVYPMHRNPNVQDPVYARLSSVHNVFLVEPLDYVPFVDLMSRAYILITDSGGVQEEGPSLGKPILVLREMTERPEALLATTVRLVGTDEQRIVSEASWLLNDPVEYARRSRVHHPYGDGRASFRIAEAIGSFFKTRSSKHGSSKTASPMSIINCICPFSSTTTCSPPTSFVDRAGRWFLDSGIQETSGGVARYYRADLERNHRISTEITGYTAGILVYLHAVTRNPKYLSRAVEAARFLARIAWDPSLRTFPFEFDEESEAEELSYFFDCGVIIRGLLSVWRATGNHEFFSVAHACARAVIGDFMDRDTRVHPILRLPEKLPLAYNERWSHSPGCYQLKSAMACYEMFEETGEEQFQLFYSRLLEFALHTHAPFLQVNSDSHCTVDRLHAYCYFLEGLLPSLKDSRCVAALAGGIAQVTELTRQIGPSFERSDVYAQLLRLRLLAATHGVVSLDRSRAQSEAEKLTQFHIESTDQRTNGGLYFGRKGEQLVPHVNPVSTAFAIQALGMWRDYQAGQLQICRHMVI
jgi:UDP-N-acetylglucosamine 2-epimerase (non-hydrolysing)